MIKIKWECGCSFEGESNCKKNDKGEWEIIAGEYCKDHKWAKTSLIDTDYFFQSTIRF